MPAEYVLTHDFNKIDGDTVTLKNLYFSVPYNYYDDKLEMLVDDNAFLCLQNQTFLGKDLQDGYSSIFYIRKKGDAKTFNLCHNDEEIQKAVGVNHIIYGSPEFDYFYPETFVVSTKKDEDGNQLVSFHCISYPKYFFFNFKK